MYPRRGNSRIIQLSETHMVDVVKFINEVKKMPIIYDCRHDQYGDRREKSKAWHEVAAAIVQGWEHMSEEVKESTEKSLRGKWRHIRDYFTKDLRARQTPPKRGVKKRNPYAYFKNLLFLLPVMGAKKGITYVEGDYKTEEVICEDHESMDSDQITFESGEQTGASFLDVSDDNVSGDPHPVDPLCETSLGPFDNDIHEAITSHSGQRAISDEEDYDKMFLLSLLPSLRQVPENMKLQVKIDMQQVLVGALRINARSGL